MTTSILESTKEKLGLTVDYTVFDNQILDFINSAFSTVTDLGIGPPTGFEVLGYDEEWDDFLAGNKRLNTVKSYIFLKVKQLFDPPTTGYLVTAMENQILALEWRMNTTREEETWVPPEPVLPDESM